MSENLQALLKESLLNNSYDYDAMHNTIKNTWMNSYSYLYYLQKAKVSYEELFYYSNDVDSRNNKKIGDLYLDSSLFANFDVDYDVISVYTREAYRLSKFYLNKFTFEDMIYNPHIFFKIPIVIIDDKLIWDYKIKVTKDCTTFTLPFKKSFVLENARNPITDDVIYISHKIQVLVVDNIFYQRYTYNKTTINYDSVFRDFTLKKSKMDEMSENTIIKEVNTEYMEKYGVKHASDLTNKQKIEINNEINRRMKCIEFPKQDGIFFASLHFENYAGKGYELGTAPIELKDDGRGNLVGALTDDINEIIKNHKYNIRVSVVFINRLYKHTFYDKKDINTVTNGGAKLLVLEQSKNVPYEAPVPVEDFMILKRDSKSSGWRLEKNTDTLQMYYPNIYRIKDKSMVDGNQYVLYYFYFPTPDLQYTVLFDFYFKFLLDTFTNKSMEEIINDIYYNKANLSQYNETQKASFAAVFKKIMDYTAFHYKYGDTDFLERYLKSSGNEDKAPVEYKDETLKEWIKENPWTLKDYVLEQNKLGESYHLFTNTLDLTQRIRTSTQTELGTGDMYQFDKPRYVFAFSNEREFPVLLDCRVFVDGILVGDVYQRRKAFMDYFYIPTDYVTNDSYIELEIFPRYQYAKEIQFSAMNKPIEITIAEPTENIYPTTADIIMANDTDKQRYYTDLFNIKCHYDNRGNFEFSSNNPEKPVKFTRLSTFEISPKTTDLLNKPLTARFSKIPIMIRFTVDRPGYAYIDTRSRDFQFNIDYLRVFRNGRLIPKNKYRLIVNHGTPKIMFTQWFDVGDLVYVDITPYRYKHIYHKDELAKGETLIDLSGIISKPFDIRYYDVYMNGRKLSLNNVFAITPWKITLVNLKSQYNLDIYERERDWEYFGLKSDESKMYFSFDDLIDSGIVSDEEFCKLIKDRIDDIKDPRLNIYPNTFDEDKIDYDDIDIIYPVFYIFYYDELLPKTFVNPDICQFSDQVMKDNFEEVSRYYETSSAISGINDIERQRKASYPKVLCLDPDIIIESEKEPPKDIIVYEVGHIGDVEQDILDSKIEILDEDSNKEKGDV
mgnify:CR=1 FL=1